MLTLVELPERILFKLFHSSDLDFINYFYRTNFKKEEAFYVYVGKMPWGFAVYNDKKKLILDEYLIEMNDSVIDFFEEQLNS